MFGSWQHTAISMSVPFETGKLSTSHHYVG